MRKIFILLAAVLAGILVFSACRKEQRQTGSGETGRITVRFLGRVGQGDFPEGSDENNNIFVDFLREKTPYDFDFTFYRLPEDRNAIIASGAKYDMIGYGAGGAELANLLILQQQNYLAPVDEYLPEANNLTDLEQIPKEVWIPLTIDGKKYAVPTPWSELYFGIGIRVDWLEKLGLQPPKTIEDLKNVLIAFRDRDPDGNGVRDTIPLSNDWLPLPPNLRSLWGIPADYFMENGKVQYAYATSAARDMVSWAADLYAEGLLDPEFATVSNEIQGQRLTNDKIGCIFQQAWWDMKFWDLAFKESKGIDYSPYWWMAPPNDIYGNPVKLQISGPMESFVVFPQDGHTKEAVDFVNRMLDLDLAETLTFGFENVHWKRDANGNRYLTEEYDNIIWRWKYCDNIIFNLEMMAESENLEYGDYRIPVQQYAGGPETWDLLTPPIIGIEQQLVDINEHTNLEVIKFIMGERPMREYDAFVAELRSIGLDEVLAAKQKAREGIQ